MWMRHTGRCLMLCAIFLAVTIYAFESRTMVNQRAFPIFMRNGMPDFHGLLSLDVRNEGQVLNRRFPYFATHENKYGRGFPVFQHIRSDMRSMPRIIEANQMI